MGELRKVEKIGEVYKFTIDFESTESREELLERKRKYEKHIALIDAQLAEINKLEATP